MDPTDWINRCAARLHRQWPNIVMADLEETAAELHAEARWSAMLPEQAAEAWLRLGALVD